MNLVKRLKEKETNCQPVNDHLSLRLLPDLLGHDLGSLHVAAEHHHLDGRRTIESLFKKTNVSEDHLGAPPAHVQGSGPAYAGVGAGDNHRLAVQLGLGGHLRALHPPLQQIEQAGQHQHNPQRPEYPRRGLLPGGEAHVFHAV